MLAELTVSDKSLAFELEIGGGVSLEGEMLPPAVYRDPDPYLGPYEVTPAREAQVLSTSGHSMSQDVVVEPIPSNYGLITYDGSKLVVS